MYDIRLAEIDNGWVARIETEEESIATKFFAEFEDAIAFIVDKAGSKAEEAKEHAKPAKKK